MGTYILPVSVLKVNDKMLWRILFIAKVSHRKCSDEEFHYLGMARYET